MKTQYEVMEQAYLVWFIRSLAVLNGKRPFITAFSTSPEPESSFIRQNIDSFSSDQSAPGVLFCADGSPPIWIDIRSQFNAPSDQEKETQNHLIDLGNIVIQANSAAEAIADLRTMDALVVEPHMPLVAVPGMPTSSSAAPRGADSEN